MRRVAATGLFFCALAVFAHAADVLSQLGIPVQAAKQAVATVLNSGVYNPGLPAGGFKVLPAAVRAEAAAAGVAWLKTYVASADFAQQYAQIRDSRKPSPPQFDGTPDDQLKKADEQQKQQAEESKAAIASLPAAQRAQVEAAMKAAQAMTAQRDTPEMRKMRLDGITAERAERTTQYELELAAWTRNFPVSGTPLIAKRQREFLAASADVDFTATLTPRNGKMVFENPAYEQKPSQWKMCYRAGKEATAAARAAVQAWLKALGG